jgi:hypothetical protein
VASEPNADPVLNRIDPNKREFMSRLIGTTAFVAPLVASFTIENLTVTNALAANASPKP